MKRNLITFVALYLLYDRQRRVERRQKLWKLRTEAELRGVATTVGKDLDGFVEWGSQLVKDVNRAMRGAR
jgi:hypothetical protein